MAKVWFIDMKRISTRAIVQWCVEHHGVDRMLVGICMCCGPGKKWGPCRHKQIKNTHRYFGDHILAKLSVAGKPGVTFYDYKHPVLIIEFNEVVAGRVIELGPRLTDWDSGSALPLPRDLCLYRRGSHFPNLVTIAHENEGWLITDREIRMRGLLRTRLNPKDISYHEGPYFCKDVKGSRFPFMKLFKVNKQLVAEHS